MANALKLKQICLKFLILLGYKKFEPKISLLIEIK